MKRGRGKERGTDSFLSSIDQHATESERVSQSVSQLVGESVSQSVSW